MMQIPKCVGFVCYLQNKLARVEFMEEAGAKYLSYMHHYLTLLSLHPDNCARRATDRMGPIVFNHFQQRKAFYTRMEHKWGPIRPPMGGRAATCTATRLWCGQCATPAHNCDTHRPQHWRLQRETSNTWKRRSAVVAESGEKHWTAIHHYRNHFIAVIQVHTYKNTRQSTSGS